MAGILFCLHTPDTKLLLSGRKNYIFKYQATFRKAQIGDLAWFYEASPTKAIVGYGTITDITYEQVDIANCNQLYIPINTLRKIFHRYWQPACNYSYITKTQEEMLFKYGYTPHKPRGHSNDTGN